MEHSILRRACALWIATLALGTVAFSQVSKEAVGSAASVRTLAGHVLLPGGDPARGALVFSSAGGSAVADEDGIYELELPPLEDSAVLRLTAVANGPQGALTVGALVRDPWAQGGSSGATLMLSAGAGCAAEWLPTFGGLPGMDGSVQSMAVFDDGSGPALFVGGFFTSVAGQPIQRLAKWDGASWSAVDAGLVGLGSIRSLRVLDDGSGPTLFAAGDMGGICCPGGVAKWSGGTWVLLGTFDNSVTSMVIFDDGSGPALHVAGGFNTAGGQSAIRIAKFDGSSWHALGQGLDHFVETLTVFDDGSGTALYAGGFFTSAGGQPANRIAKWDGSTWSALGSGVDGVAARVHALTAFDDGSGMALYVGGTFTTAGGQAASRIARWDGSTWSTAGAGSPTTVYALKVHDSGFGPELYATAQAGAGNGSAPFAGGIARWNGSQWSGVGNGVQNGPVYDLVAFDAGSGEELHAGGHYFGAAGMSARSIARFNGVFWESFDGGVTNDVNALAVFDDGGGPALFVAGTFLDVGGIFARRIVRWRNGSWTAVGTGVSGPIRALKVFDDGSGPALYAGGDFHEAGGQLASSLARWNGSAWSAVGAVPIGGGIWGEVRALASFDDGSGPALYAAGLFGHAGGLPASNIARWDGSSWSAVGGGVGANWVDALEVFDDGSGPGLYAGGQFFNAGGVPANHLARWNGTVWSGVGGGVGGPDAGVRTMAVYDDGQGPQLYVGGFFNNAGGMPANTLVRWNGSSWSTIPGGVPSGTVLVLRAVELGGANELFAGGGFHTPGRGIARWNGVSWSSLGDGILDQGSFFTQALDVYDTGSGPALIVGGRFVLTSGGDSYLAAWGCPLPLATAYCFGDGAGAPCPCGNSGGSGEGCANGSGLGAVLAASGSASVTAGDLVLTANQMLPSNPGLFFQGTGQPGGGAGIPFGDGLRCAGGAVKRIQVRISSLAAVAHTTLDVAAKGDASAGQTLHYQLWYRDTFTSPCGGFFNTSNGLSITWQP